jgi:nucleotide-binding universal stress UspA family protein
MFQNVLVPVDLSQEHSWRKALPTATRLCQAFQARLHLITVVPDFGLPMVGQYFPEGYEASRRQHSSRPWPPSRCRPRCRRRASSPKAGSTGRS